MLVAVSVSYNFCVGVGAFRAEDSLAELLCVGFDGLVDGADCIAADDDGADADEGLDIGASGAAGCPRELVGTGDELIWRV